MMKKDYYYLGSILLFFALIPLCIKVYNRSLTPERPQPGIKAFTLTGHSEKGWILGDVKAWDILTLFKKDQAYEKPVIRVSLNDQVILKLRSADVTHGFTLKSYGIYIPQGIEPGRTRFVKFRADKVGTFVFACNVFCGDIHPAMQGTLVVEK